jgi:hypothetical protein
MSFNYQSSIQHIDNITIGLLDLITDLRLHKNLLENQDIRSHFVERFNNILDEYSQQIKLFPDESVKSYLLSIIDLYTFD